MQQSPRVISNMEGKGIAGPVCYQLAMRKEGYL